MEVIICSLLGIILGVLCFTVYRGYWRGDRIVQDGDIVIIRSPLALRPETAKALREAVQEMIQRFGFKVNVMVLEQEVEIGVLRKEENDGEKQSTRIGSKEPVGIFKYSE